MFEIFSGFNPFSGVDKAKIETLEAEKIDKIESVDSTIPVFDGAGGLKDTDVTIDEAGTITANAFKSLDTGAMYFGVKHFRKNGGVTGAIVLRLPPQASSKASMITLGITAYIYGTNKSFSMTLAGYDYKDERWLNVTATRTGTNDNTKRVRFTRDLTTGVKCIIIGEDDSTWDYPNIFLKEVLVGYSGYISDFSKNWEFSIETDLSNYDTSSDSKDVEVA